MSTDPQTDRLDDLRTEYANTGMVTPDGAVWLFSQVVVLRERLDRLSAILAGQAVAVDRAAVYRELADQQTQLAVVDDLGRRRDMATARRQLVKELRRLAAETPGPETQAAAVLLSSPCDACRHTLNWHRNDIGCVVARCVCSRFQPPTDTAPAVTLPGKEA